MAKIEFYEGSEKPMVAAVEDGAVPRGGEFINIRGETWEVTRVTWALDQADSIRERRLRANVEMKRARG